MTYRGRVMPCRGQISAHISFQLNSIGWNGSNKMSVCPGIVELTQRFNRISFWVISVILQKQTNKIRSEVVQQFIKIAKRLHDLRKVLKISIAHANVHTRLVKSNASQKDIKIKHHQSEGAIGNNIYF